MAKRLIFLMNRWMSEAGGIQTVNRELASAVASEYPDLECTCVVTTATEAEVCHAQRNHVELMPGDREDDWLSVKLARALGSITPEDVLAILGHGRFSGSAAAHLKATRFPQA